MKNAFALVLALVSANSAHATCIEKYQKARDERVLGKIATGLTTGGGMGVTLGMLGGSASLMMVGFPVIALGGGIMLAREARYSRVINLLEDATAFANKPSSTPSKRLVRFHEKLSRPEVSLLTIAEYLRDGNADGSLCDSEKLGFYQSLKESMEEKQLNVIDVPAAEISED